MSLGTILLIILIIALLGGFSGLGGGRFYGTGYYGGGGTRHSLSCRADPGFTREDLSGRRPLRVGSANPTFAATLVACPLVSQARPFRPPERSPIADPSRPAKGWCGHLSLVSRCWLRERATPPASRTNGWPPGVWGRSIRDHDHTGATASYARFVIRSLLRLFRVHGLTWSAVVNGKINTASRVRQHNAQQRTVDF